MKIAILGAGLLIIYLGVTGRYRPVWEVFFPPSTSTANTGGTP